MAIQNIERDGAGETRTARRKRERRERERDEAYSFGRKEAARLRADRERNRWIAVVCSWPWLEDIAFHGAVYDHSHQCRCRHCLQRFPLRRNPTPVRESNISIDCQAEFESDDHGLRHELRQLRNDPERVGSAVMRATPHEYPLEVGILRRVKIAMDGDGKILRNEDGELLRHEETWIVAAE